MDGDEDVPDVDKPEGVIEAESGEKIAGSIVSERGIA